MPYTPPSQQSPATSKPSTPSSARSDPFGDHSCQAGSLARPNSRPDIPRSQTYLSRHRRTPSVNEGIRFADKPVQKTEASKEHASNSNGKEAASLKPSGSLHQSPPPKNDSLIPSGVVISPPDSQNNSSDEENPRKRRGRKLENLAELQAAIRRIELRRGGSPTRKDEPRRARYALDLATPRDAKATPESNVAAAAKQPMTTCNKELSSSPDAEVVSDKSSTPEESDSESNFVKPPMVRKKSGELVKPALRPTCVRRRPSSMPGTPTYSKAVHFDNKLEHVRHFLQVDRPLAVSAGSSPVEAYDSDVEFPWGIEDRSPPFEWEIVLSDFPRETAERKKMPVRVERVFLSNDKQNLVGSVAVANIAFHKHVVARFTLDYWKTTSEVVAEFNNDVRRKQVNDGYDRFNFTIKLADQTNLENKTLFFCVRYSVNGQDFWDSNGHTNFRVDFQKKAKAQMGKGAMQGAASRPLTSLPRSRPSPPVTNERPRSMPVSFDDFSTGFDTNYDFSLARQPPAKLIGESPSSTIRLKQPKLSRAPIPDTPARRNNPAGQAFGNRYDFGASLSAAINAATAGPKAVANRNGRDGDASSKPTGSDVKAPAKAESFASDKTNLQSQSYTDLLNKYCFFGSAKSSPTAVPERPAAAQTDGASDSVVEAKTGGAAAALLKESPVSPKTEDSTPEEPGSSTFSSGISPSRSRSRSSSPMSAHTSSGYGSPASFGYPYHHGARGGFAFSESHTPTAIRG
ncbi:MAG: hypothetical protein M1817_004633 [Caeruleum heppii]|nr:MAG: hypothetical protein M1817_004633 [Caeruleum heppii]